MRNCEERLVIRFKFEVKTKVFCFKRAIFHVLGIKIMQNVLLTSPAPIKLAPYNHEQPRTTMKQQILTLQKYLFCKEFNIHFEY